MLQNTRVLQQTLLPRSEQPHPGQCQTVRWKATPSLLAQDVLTNLMISAIEFRAEDDPDLAAYTHAKRIELRTVSPSREARLSISICLPCAERFGAMKAHVKVSSAFWVRVRCVAITSLSSIHGCFSCAHSILVFGRRGLRCTWLLSTCQRA